jgi:hypothetical protein
MTGLLQGFDSLLEVLKDDGLNFLADACFKLPITMTGKLKPSYQ